MRGWWVRGALYRDDRGRKIVGRVGPWRRRALGQGAPKIIGRRRLLHLMST